MAPERKAEVLRAVATERLSLRAAGGSLAWTGTRSLVGSKKVADLPSLGASLLPTETGDVLALDEL